MPQKMYSLHLGVNFVDESHYVGALQDLHCCTNDASAMQNLMNILNYDDTKILLNEEATTVNFKKQLRAYSRKLVAGDLLVLTYSGHGGLMEDLDGDEKNKKNGNGFDSTWCMYDRQLLDDELPPLWAKFKTGVNIFVILDSCHSGTSVKAAPPPMSLSTKGMSKAASKLVFMDNFVPQVKTMSIGAAGKVFRANEEEYTRISNEVRSKSGSRKSSKSKTKSKSKPRKINIKASVQLMAACQDDEEALTGFTFSQLTGYILDNLGQTKRYDTFEKLFKKVRKDYEQRWGVSPNWLPIGKTTDYFTTKRPFIRTGDKYPLDFKKIEDKLEDGIFAAETKSFSMDGLIVDAPATTQKSIMKSAKKLITNETALSKSVGRGETKAIFVETAKKKGVSHPWDQAYDFYIDHAAGRKDVFVEPAFYGDQVAKSKTAADRSSGVGSYLSRWPNPTGHPEEFAWHLSEDYSQLAKARDSVMKEFSAAQRKIRIAQFDSGYIPSHPSKPDHVMPGISFVKGEKGQPAFEKRRGTFAENEYHGTATLALLAGSKLKAKQTYAKFEGYMGAIPFAQVYPVRISDTVALVGLFNNTRQFTQAVEYAIANKCEVITMSMGGQPHRSWAKAINRAYEKGITIVTAAGNSFNKGALQILPKKLIYPARFDRVIAATGITYNKEPYVFDANMNVSGKMAGGENMQGNFGPKDAMNTAIAAYTPNVPWAVMHKGKPIFQKSGGGTSSATPQVAAAAALWIVKNRKELKAKKYAGTWKQVEAVRHALFSSADQSYPLWNKYYGCGALKAFDALKVPVPSVRKLKQADKARVTPFAFLEFVQLIVFRKGRTLAEKRDKKLEEMVGLEMLQVLYSDPDLKHFLEELNVFEKKALTQKQFNFLFDKIKESKYSSNFIKRLNQGRNF